VTTGDAQSGTGQRWLLAAVSATVIGTDQAVKWWAWRHVDGSLINSGGYILLGPGIRSWFADPASGALSDVIGGVVLIAAVRQLLRRRRSTCVLLGGSLVVAGWVSNILDRLGLHNWTAPGSARGVVDFIPGGGPGRSNVADLWIVVGALLLVYALARRLAGRPIQPGAAGRPSDPHRAFERVAVLIVLLAVITLAITSALDHRGVSSPTSLGSFRSSR
jgi:lipoprotein signal peptidase